MPSNDKNVSDEDKSVTKESYTITIYLAKDNKIYYIKGMPKYDDPSCLQLTNWGKDGNCVRFFCYRLVFVAHILIVTWHTQLH